MSPCDLQAAKNIDLPDIALASWRADLPNAGGPVSGVNVSNNGQMEIGDKSLSQALVPKFNSPPLYLQKLSFLI
jgi:hypothetical protein